MFAHATPLPANPRLHEHEKLPALLEHAALLWQLSMSRLHSLTSLQVSPLPLYPTVHAHVNDPFVLVQREPADAQSSV